MGWGAAQEDGGGRLGVRGERAGAGGEDAGRIWARARAIAREREREALKLKRGRRGGENGERSSVSRFYFARGRLVKSADFASEPAGTGRLCFVSDGKKTNSIGFLRARLL